MTKLVLAALLLQSTDYQAEGLKALEAQKYEAAARNFAKAVEEFPADYGVRFHLALSLSLLNKDAEAIPVYKKTLELQPGLYQAELNLGILLLRQQDPAAALPYLTAAVEKKPKEFRPNYYLAEALFATGEFAKAEAAYRGADPASASTMSGLARTLAKQGKLDEAAPRFRKAAETDPSFRDQLLELASLYEQAKRIDEAIAIYEKFPENPAVRERLGSLMLANGRAADAIPSLEQAVAKSPTAANHYALAAAYIRSKQPDKAEQQLQAALKLEPANLELRLTYGRLLRDQGLQNKAKFIAAANEFIAAVKTKPDSLESWRELTGMLMVTDNYQQAIAALDNIKKLGEETPGQVYFRALCYDHLKLQKQAVESYDRFLEMSQNVHPDEEFKARQRSRILKKELSKK